MTFDQLKALAPHFDWAQEFDTLAVPTQGHLNVDQPKLLQAFDGLLTSVSLEDWRAYIRWHILNHEAAYLADPIEIENFSFVGTVLSGVHEQRPRWQRCVLATDRELGDALGHEYVAPLPTSRSCKARARTMALNIVNRAENPPSSPATGCPPPPRPKLSKR